MKLFKKIFLLLILIISSHRCYGAELASTEERLPGSVPSTTSTTASSTTRVRPLRRTMERGQLKIPRIPETKPDTRPQLEILFDLIKSSGKSDETKMLATTFALQILHITTREEPAAILEQQDASGDTALHIAVVYANTLFINTVWNKYHEDLNQCHKFLSITNNKRQTPANLAAEHALLSMENENPNAETLREYVEKLWPLELSITDRTKNITHSITTPLVPHWRLDVTITPDNDVHAIFIATTPPKDGCCTIM